MAVTGWNMALLFMGAAVLVAIFISVARARGAGTSRPVVRLAFIVATAWATLTLAGAILITVFWFTPNTYPNFELRVQYNPWDQNCTSAPVDDPNVPCVYGTFTEADITASGLSLSTRQLLAAGDLVGSLVTVLLASLVALACYRLMQGRPFAPEIARLALIAAGVCLVGGLTAQLLLQVGGAQAAGEVIAAGIAPTGMIAAPALSIDFWPIGAAIGLGAFSVLLRYGSQLQRETDLLV